MSNVTNLTKEASGLSLASFIVSPKKSIVGDAKAYNELIAGAHEWQEPEINISNLKRMTSTAIEKTPASLKSDYSLYHICIIDYYHHKAAKPEFCNLISMIAYNAINILNVGSLEELKESDSLSSRSELINSGLFLYQSSDEERVSSTLTPDSYLNLCIPKDVENELIKPNPYKATYRVSSDSPALNGVIMKFNDMKNLLLNPKVVAYTSLAYENGLYNKHTLLHRDAVNYNLIYQDIDKSDVTVIEQYLL